MASTVKRISIALSREDLRQLEALKLHFGESQSCVMKRALNALYSTLKIFENSIHSSTCPNNR
jgi:hypothetical protein